MYEIVFTETNLTMNAFRERLLQIKLFIITMSYSHINILSIKKI